MVMVGELGGAEAARQLLRGRDASDGFTILWEYGRLGMSVEAFVLLPWYRELFTEEQLETADRRLREHRFDVERFLRDSTQSPPAWATSDPSQAG
jgi:citrate synthase